VGRTRFARSDGLRIAYELRGSRLWSRRPWLVLVQGLGFDRSGWDPVARQLRRHFRLLLVDNRGCGRSAVAERQFTVADMARDVVATLDAARIRKAHLAGASLGGMVAQEVAIGYPDRVDRLVLACTTPGWPYAYPMPPTGARLIAATRGLTQDVAARRYVQNALAADTVAGRPELVDRLLRHQQARPNAAGFSALAAAGARYTGHLRQAKIRARTLILHGDADTVVDPRNAALLASRIPDATLVMLPGLGHLFFWEDPDTFVDAVTAFLTDHPSDAPQGGSAGSSSSQSAR
jgi:3-oxoadipate enol-lactonase